MWYNASSNALLVKKDHLHIERFPCLPLLALRSQTCSNIPLFQSPESNRSFAKCEMCLYMRCISEVLCLKSSQFCGYIQSLVGFFLFSSSLNNRTSSFISSDLWNSLWFQKEYAHEIKACFFINTKSKMFPPRQELVWQLTGSLPTPSILCLGCPASFSFTIVTL